MQGMSISDDTMHWMAHGYDAYKPTPTNEPAKRQACRNCGNSITFVALCVTGEGWWFECRRCGFTTMFTDQEMGTFD